MANLDIRAALDAISATVGQLAADAGYLKAEHWALEQTLKEGPPEFYERLGHFRSQAEYQTTRSGYVMMLSNIQEALNKL